MSDPAVSIRSLSYAYRRWPWSREQRALSEVTLELAAGQVHALIGSNGAGKSTLLKILAGVLPAARGAARVVGSPPGDRRIRAQVAFLPETSDVPSRLKVREALSLQGSLHGLPAQAVQERSAQVLEETELDGLAGRRLDSLSKGQRRRVTLAQTLLPRPRLLLLDEPLSGVDPVTGERLREVLRRYAADGATLLWSSHLLQDVADASDTLSVLEEGKLITHGETSAVLERDDEWQITVKAAAGDGAPEEWQERLEIEGAVFRRSRRTLADLLRRAPRHGGGPSPPS